MKIQLIRHATIRLQYAGVSFLIDPMFSDAGVNPPINNSTNDRRNPLVPLPVNIDTLLTADAVLVTHLHQDHWDAAAAAALPKSTPILCQPGNDASIASAGFDSVTAHSFHIYVQECAYLSYRRAAWKWRNRTENGPSIRVCSSS